MKRLCAVLIVLVAGCGPSAQAQYDAAVARLEAEQREYDRLKAESDKAFDAWMKCAGEIGVTKAALEESPDDTTLTNRLRRLEERVGVDLRESNSALDRKTEQSWRLDRAKKQREEAERRLGK